MRAYEAGDLLTRLARGGEVELGPSEGATLAELLQAGLVARVPDVERDARELEAVRAELAARSASAAARTPEMIARERELRARALELVERVSRADGAALVRDTSSYRGSSTAEAYVVTFAARSLLSDLGARLVRVGSMSLDDFRRHMDVLREVFTVRARRAQGIAAQMFLGLSGSGISMVDRAVRASAIGLAARNEQEAELASTWLYLTREFARADLADGTGANEWTMEQHASYAEAMMLAVPTIGALRGGVATLHQQRLAGWRADPSHSARDALAASVLVAGMTPTDADRVLQEAFGAVRAAEGWGARLPLSAAVVLSRAGIPSRLDALVQIVRRLQELGEGSEDRERMDAATVLVLDPRNAELLIARVRELRAYLERFATGGMLVPAALLALLPCEVPESLDLLRMMSTALQQERFMAGGAETLVLSIKMLLTTALLAMGSEGDFEERAGWLRFDALASSQLGAAGIALATPLSLAGLTVFQNPVLDQVEFDRAYQATHSPYVFHPSRGYGWG